MFDFLMGLVFAVICFSAYKIVAKDEKTMKYLTSPVDGKFDINWTTRQIIALFNTNASERWYESRAHCHKGILVSVLATLHLIWIVRTDMGYNDDDMFYCKYSYFHGFQSFETLKKKCLSKKFLDKIIDIKKNYYYQTFICGYNVVNDFVAQEY